MNVNFVVKVIDENDDAITGYVLNLDLPFIPNVGMKITGGTSCLLWETQSGRKLNPKIQEVVYNMDEEAVYCLFEINELLSSSRWVKINVNGSLEMHQFESN